MTGTSTSLVRGINLTAAVALVVGSMIGSGIFIVSADIAAQHDDHAGTQLVGCDAFPTLCLVVPDPTR